MKSCVVNYFFLIILFCMLSSVSMAREVSTDSSHAMVFEIIQDQISFNQPDIARATILNDDHGIYKGLLIQLKPYAAKELKRMTKANIGKKVNLVFRQRIISSTFIQSELGDSFLLSSISKKDALIFIKMLNSANANVG